MAKAKTKVRLNDEDWQALFPGDDFVIGTTTMQIVPLSIASIAKITARLSVIGTGIDKLNLAASDIDTAITSGATSQVVDLVNIILTQAPDILSEMSDLHIEDTKNLPLGIATELFLKCLEVNIDSQESLVKNLKSLGTKLGQFLNPEEPTPATISPVRQTLVS